jgi:outer membrane protein assembly factor BamB
MRFSMLTAAVFCVSTCAIDHAVAAENWPHWRGPLGTGVAAAGEYPIKFSPKEGVAWQVDLPGKGTSTPAVWNDRIILRCAIDEDDGVICYDMQGKELWRKKLGAERPGKHRNGSGSNPSPVTDGKNVVVYFKSGRLACFDIDGDQKWMVNLQEKFGPDTLWWDLGTSPVFANGCAVVAVVHTGDSYLAAFDLNNGDVKWKVPRVYECAEESDQTYSTPVVVNSDGKGVIVTWGADHLTGHNAADGKLLWESGNFNPENKRAWRTIASISVGNGVAVVPYGRGKFLAGVRLDGRGDITKSNRIWDKQIDGPDVPTAVARDGKVIVLGDTGHLTCLAIESGDELWSADLPRNRNKFYASPILAGDKLFCIREDGTVFVGQVSDTGYEELAANEMGERIIACPVPLRGGLLIRGEEHLYRIETNGTAAK